MGDFNKQDYEVAGGYESFTERGGFEDICISYDLEPLRYFLDGAKALIDELDMDAVESVLDVGTGTGHTALELAKRYPNCKVTGVDNSPGMLSQAELKKGDLSNITFQRNDWEELQRIQGEFDLVTNSFGVSFIKDINKFAISVASKVKQNGVFAFVHFDDGGFEPLVTELFSDLERMSLLRRIPTQLSPVNKLLVKQMEYNGIKTQKITNKVLKYSIKRSEEWWTIVSQTAIKENFFYDITEKELEEFKCIHLNNIQRMIDKGDNTLTITITIFVGKRL